MSLTSIDGSILVSKSTILRLLNAVRHTPLSNQSTLFDAGVEEQKRQMAEILKGEFKLTSGFNPARDLRLELKK